MMPRASRNRTVVVRSAAAADASSETLAAEAAAAQAAASEAPDAAARKAAATQKKAAAAAKAAKAKEAAAAKAARAKEAAAKAKEAAAREAATERLAEARAAAAAARTQVAEALSAARDVVGADVAGDDAGSGPDPDLEASSDDESSGNDESDADDEGGYDDDIAGMAMQPPPRTPPALVSMAESHMEVAIAAANLPAPWAVSLRSAGLMDPMTLLRIGTGTRSEADVTVLLSALAACRAGLPDSNGEVGTRALRGQAAALLSTLNHLDADHVRARAQVLVPAPELAAAARPAGKITSKRDRKAAATAAIDSATPMLQCQLGDFPFPSNLVPVAKDVLLAVEALGRTVPRLVSLSLLSLEPEEEPLVGSKKVEKVAATPDDKLRAWFRVHAVAGACVADQTRFEPSAADRNSGVLEVADRASGALEAICHRGTAARPEAVLVARWPVVATVCESLIAEATATRLTAGQRSAFYRNVMAFMDKRVRDSRSTFTAAAVAVAEAGLAARQMDSAGSWSSDSGSDSDSSSSSSSYEAPLKRRKKEAKKKGAKKKAGEKPKAQGKKARTSTKGQKVGGQKKPLAGVCRAWLKGLGGEGSGCPKSAKTCKWRHDIRDAKK